MAEPQVSAPRLCSSGRARLPAGFLGFLSPAPLFLVCCGVWMLSHVSEPSSAHDQANRSTGLRQGSEQIRQVRPVPHAVAGLYFAPVNQLHGGPAVAKVTDWL